MENDRIRLLFILLLLRNINQLRNMNDVDSNAVSTTAAISSVPISDVIAQMDEAAKRRLENMNSELKGLELRMKELEAKLYTANNLKPLYGDADARY
ncbi:hypothetical protein ZOSMA_117G00490 [Zostera marina]|uniref:Uncharacterized protein n=1 Tax=Zostera marina TaxID=29655 RepID=A0A0K9Q451_ZOSMR|nr:hypothetical protein ZOSMA_117G00490 [Zostera marina]